MKRVAKFLETKTLKSKSPDEINVFGRSTFNRYYYATFWIVRSTLVAIDEKWAEPTHKAIPDILTKAFLKKVRNQLKKALLSPAEREKLKFRATTSATELAALLEHAYLVRIEADYRPESQARKEGNHILMGTTKSSDASDWPRKAEMHKGAIIDVSRKIGLI